MSPPAIVLQSATKRFGLKAAVDSVSFEVEQGSVFGLIGPNGAGKTTLFSLLCGYLHPTSGQVRVLDRNPVLEGSLKGVLGALPQDAVLPSGWKTGPLLAYWAALSGLPQPESEARDALSRVGLEQAWDSEANTLSHGMAKRVGLAQALMGKPPVLLLDEPTAGLDPRVAAMVRQLIREMRGSGQTVVVSSHNLSELEELCDAAAVLDRGQLAQRGTLAQLTGQSDEFRVQVARGKVPFAELSTVSGVQSAQWERPGVLLIRFAGARVPAEEVISEALRTLLAQGVLVSGVSRGQKLEQKVLSIL